MVTIKYFLAVIRERHRDLEHHVGVLLAAQDEADAELHHENVARHWYGYEPYCDESGYWFGPALVTVESVTEIPEAEYLIIRQYPSLALDTTAERRDEEGPRSASERWGAGGERWGTVDDSCDAGPDEWIEQCEFAEAEDAHPQLATITLLWKEIPWSEADTIPKIVPITIVRHQLDCWTGSNPERGNEAAEIPVRISCDSIRKLLNRPRRPRWGRV